MYKCSTFSLSASITDGNGVLLARQKRAGWWGLSFDMETADGGYRFYQRYFDYFIEHESGEQFRTHLSADFYDSKVKRVTSLRYAKKLGKYWEFDAFTVRHKWALLLASVTICKLTSAT